MAWIREASPTHVFMSMRKSMTVKTYVHSTRKRAESTALLDLGAMENFMSLSYAKWLGLPIKTLETPRPIFNINGTTNRSRDLHHYTDLKVRTGSNYVNMRFFLTDLGQHQVIFGYPWFATNQPHIDWKRGWIDEHQLPIVIKAENAHKVVFLPRGRCSLRPLPNHQIFIARVQFATHESTPAELAKIPAKYHCHARVFSEAVAQRFPEPRIWDHTIELKPGAPTALPG